MRFISGTNSSTTLNEAGQKPARPEGLGATALLMSAFLVIDYVQQVMRLSGGSASALLTMALLPKVVVSFGVALVVFFVIWNYWQGENWSRHLVLIWSALIGLEGVSQIWENGGSLTSAMAHPVLFLKCVLAGFLLYWLNTAPLRAYFRGTPTIALQFGQRLEGKLCTAVQQHGIGAEGEYWRIVFEHDGELVLECPWRVVVDGNVSFATTSGAGFTPEVHPSHLLQNVRVKAVRVAPKSCDLIVAFEMGFELQTWTNASREVQWRYSEPDFELVADARGVRMQSARAGLDAAVRRAND